MANEEMTKEQIIEELQIVQGYFGRYAHGIMALITAATGTVQRAKRYVLEGKPASEVIKELGYTEEFLKETRTNLYNARKELAEAIDLIGHITGERLLEIVPRPDRKKQED